MNWFQDLRAQVPLRLLGRYGGLMIRYGSLWKVNNLASALISWARGRQIITSMPVCLKAEISRQCHVHCLYCFAAKSDDFISLDEFKKLIQMVQQSAVMVQLHEIGEPLLHPDVIECIRFAHACGLGTVISTSLSIARPDSFWLGLAESGLDHLIVAIDGATQEVYQKYRTRGDFELVLANLQRIIKSRARIGSRMTIEWQMIDFPWNRHEQSTAREMSHQFGCDVFRLIPDASVREDNVNRGVVRQRNCIWSFLLLLVNAYGDVMPCFKPGCGPTALGNLREQSFAEIWNGQQMRRIRNRHSIADCQGCRHCGE